MALLSSARSPPHIPLPIVACAVGHGVHPRRPGAEAGHVELYGDEHPGDGGGGVSAETMSLLLTAAGDCPAITPDMIARVVAHEHRFDLRDISVALCFPEDYIITLADRVQRDLVYEGRVIEVAGVRFQLRPWLPPPGGNKV